MALPLVFVVGCERSGTSWVRSIFEAHPQALAPAQESHVWLRADEAALGVDAGRSWHSLLDRYEAEEAAPAGLHHWIGRADLAELVARAAARQEPPAATADWLAGTVLELWAARAWSDDARVGVEKTPSHVFFAERILSRLPGALFVEALRDGRDVCVSMQHRARTKAWVPQTRRAQIERWVSAVAAGRHAAALPQMADRWHVVRFEQMKADPAREVDRLLRFAGLARGGGVVDRIVAETRIDRYRRTGPDEHRRRGDVGEWREQFDDGDCGLFAELAGPTARRAGYDAAADAPSTAATRTGKGQRARPS